MDGKIGVFVRYSSRKDDSLYKSPANCFVRLNNRKSDLQCFRDYIKKHSKNIIDLIEVGDYVNGRRVLEIERTKNNEIEICILKGNVFSDWITINDKNMKSIVTKEQFAQAEHKIKEDK